MLLLLLIGLVGLTIGIVLAYLRSRRRTLPPGARPTLATVICLWEFIVAIMLLVSQMTAVYYRTLALPPGVVSIHPAYSPSDAVQAVECLFGLAAGIALWRMMRFALPLFAIKFAVSLASAVHFDIHHPVPASQGAGMRTAVYLYQVLFVVVSVAILWYVHRITSPQPTSTQPLPPPIPSL
jgi:hypothetical protein